MTHQYFAGLFDGEGCILSSMTGNSCQVWPKIAMTDEKPIQALFDTYGGNKNIEPSRNPNWRDLHRRECYGADALKFLQSIRPHTIVKSAEIDIALAVYSITPQRKVTKGRKPVTPEIAAARRKLFVQLRSLKTRGKGNR